MSSPLPVRALLVDLEGTVYEAGRAVPGVGEALQALSARGIPHLFVTNTTSRPRSAIARELAGMGVRTSPERILTAPLAARRYLLEHGLTRCHLLVRKAVFEDLAGVEPDDAAPQAVLLGDIGDEFTYERLNRAFRLLLAGAKLVTLARNRYYLAGDGLVLDQGPFVAALECAAGVTATLVGKPSPEFYRAALDLLGLPPSQVAIVGDDVEADVAGGMALGMKGILVRTGKFRQEELARSCVRPDAVIDSLAEIPQLLTG